MGHPIWNQLKHFKITENWGEPERMHPQLLIELEAFREKIATPIVVTCGTQGSHAKESEHYKGNAVDIVLPKVPLKELPDVLMEALRFKFNGLGIYSFWKYNGDVVGGLHLDVRTAKHRALWLCHLEGGKPKYADFSVQGLMTHFGL